MTSSSATLIMMRRILELIIGFCVLVAIFIGLLLLAKRIIVLLRDVAMPLWEAGATLGAKLKSVCKKLAKIPFFVLVATFTGLLSLAKRIIMPRRDGVVMPLREAGATLGTCSFCARLCITRCSRCKAAPYYCSELCQSEHWKSVHKYECAKQTEDQERVRFLEEEIAKSKNEIAKLKSECNKWATTNSFVSRGLSRESEEVHQIAEEEARVTERSEQDEHVQMPASDRARLKTELEEQRKLAQRLRLELNEAQITGSKVKEISEELVSALDDVENARSRAENAESECAKLNKELREHKKLVQRLKPKHNESQILKKKVEELNQELLTAFNDVANAKSAEKKCANQKKELQELQKLVEKLKREQEEAKREAEETNRNLASTLNDLNIAETCAICLTNKRDTAFGCGHMTCQSCGNSVSSCPVCRMWISQRIKLFFH